jgi:hypothetical protein
MGVLFFLGYTSVIFRYGRNFSRPTVYCSFFKVGRLLPSLSSYCQPLPFRAAFMAATAVCQVTVVPSTLTACYWSGLPDNDNGGATKVDGTTVTWQTAVAAMNAALSGKGWQYELKDGNSLPTLKKEQ